jgi:hypothetical protein
MLAAEPRSVRITSFSQSNPTLYRVESGDDLFTAHRYNDFLALDTALSPLMKVRVALPRKLLFHSRDAKYARQRALEQYLQAAVAAAPVGAQPLLLRFLTAPGAPVVQQEWQAEAVRRLTEGQAMQAHAQEVEERRRSTSEMNSDGSQRSSRGDRNPSPLVRRVSFRNEDEPMEKPPGEGAEREHSQSY